MPRNYPVEPDAAERRSHAERVVWAALQELPDEAVVISQFRVVDDRGVLREADFVVLIPDVGVGVVEVKGGLVWAVDGEWISRDSRGRDHSIKDPMFQAQKAGFAIRDFVTGQGVAWPSWVPVVILPDTRLRADFAPPDSKRGDWIDGRAHLAARLSAAVHTGEDFDADELVAVMERRLPRPSPRQKAELAARRADTITRDQYPILRALRSNNRILVTGGPGTGKTWLALEHARQETVRGARVAVLCYNRGLALDLNRRAAQWPVAQRPAWIGTMHQLALDWTGIEVPADAGPAFGDGLPAQLAAVAPASDQRFDLVVVDEAQDFAPGWWQAVRSVLWEPDTDPMVIFGDDDQELYGRGATGLPAVEGELTQNVRNTLQIARVLQALTGEPQEVRGASGPPVEFFPATAEDACTVADDVVRTLLDSGDYGAGDIALLTTWRRHRVQEQRLEELGAVAFAESLLSPDQVAVCTVKGFKGLERLVVVLAINGFHEESDAEHLLRVGVSRARDLLVVVGPQEWLERLGWQHYVTEPDRCPAADVYSPTASALPAVESGP